MKPQIGLAKAGIALLLLFVAGVGHGANLKDIEFTARPGGSFDVLLKFDRLPPAPKGYAIQKPARIALDLVGVTSALPQKKYTLGYDNANSAVVIEGADRTRLVLNLLTPAPYSAVREGNNILVKVGNAEARDYLKPSYTEPALERKRNPVASAGGKQITDLDFRRAENGEGRLIISLSNPQVDVNVYVEGSRIKVDFADAALPAKLQRRYDVTDFATPVKLIDARQDGRGSLFSIEVGDDYDYLAYQADGEYVLSVKPLDERELERKRKEFAYTGEKLSLNFQDIEVRAVLQLLADFTGLNLVASDTVKGNITLRLNNVPWDQALDLVLKTRGLDKRQVGNVLLVAPAAEIAERERQQIESQKQVEELAPLQTEFIRVRYASAQELFKLFVPPRDARQQDGASGSILSPRGKVIVDDRTNSLLVTETAEKLEEFRRLVNLIDVPVRQVQIEARIVRANTSVGKALGVRWGGALFNTTGDTFYGVNSDNENILDTQNSFVEAGRGDGNAMFQNGMFVDLGATAPTGSIALGFLRRNIALQLELSAMESQGQGEIVSQPKLITGDKEPATIKSGTQIPFQESGGDGTTTTNFVDAVLQLEVTPIITPDDRVLMELTITQDAVGQLVFNGQPTIDTTELKTNVLVGNGETVVLGGVYNTSKIESTAKVPFLGDLPGLGRFFRSTQNTAEKTETLIFITPRILADTLIE